MTGGKSYFFGLRCFVCFSILKRLQLVCECGYLCAYYAGQLNIIIRSVIRHIENKRVGSRLRHILARVSPAVKSSVQFGTLGT